MTAHSTRASRRVLRSCRRLRGKRLPTVNTLLGTCWIQMLSLLAGRCREVDPSGDLGAGQRWNDESAADILQGIQDLADAVSDDIYTAWESFASFLPAPLPPDAEAIEPETPRAEPTKPTVAMRDAAVDLARLREGCRQGAVGVRRINEVGHDPEGSQ